MVEVAAGTVCAQQEVVQTRFLQALSWLTIARTREVCFRRPITQRQARIFEVNGQRQLREALGEVHQHRVPLHPRLKAQAHGVLVDNNPPGPDGSKVNGKVDPRVDYVGYLNQHLKSGLDLIDAAAKGVCPVRGPLTPSKLDKIYRHGRLKAEDVLKKAQKRGIKLELQHLMDASAYGLKYADTVFEKQS